MNTSIRYPRNTVIRKTLISIGRLILPLLARIETDGLNSLPKKGPAILAGNHENIIEVVLMAVYSPALVEFIGTGDVPIDPRFAWLANLYQFIPIKRGNVDRAAIYTALEVLKAGGVIGIFPQGGIWGADVKSGRSGVGLLSHFSGAPVYPIGFGGLRGALGKIMRFQRPRLTMRVGNPLKFSPNGKHHTQDKEELERFSSLVMERITELLPAEEKNSPRKTGENFDVEVLIWKNGSGSQGLEEFDLMTRKGLGVLFHYPVLLDTLKRNLGLPVGCLQNFGHPVAVRDVEIAAMAILNYLEKDNPGFFTYRFGVDQGLVIKNALTRLQSMALDYGEDTFFVFTPIYEYSDNGRIITLRGNNSLHPLA
jgi:1-acyl-sn-glycerol-3-phosphate acyltransferase